MEALVVAISILIPGSVRVSGTTQCPSPAAVQSILSEDAAFSTEEEGADRVLLSSEAAELQVRLFDPQGRLLERRSLQTNASCASLARAVAVVLEAMEQELLRHPGVDIVVPQPRRPVASVVWLGGSEARPPVNAWRLDVGIALAGSAAEAGFAPLGALTLTVHRRVAPLRFEAALVADGDRQLSVGSGTVGYQRWWLSLGAGYTLQRRRIALELELAALGGLVSVDGEQLVKGASLLGVELGGMAGLLVASPLGWGTGWVGLFGTVWPAATKVEVVTSQTTRTLPQAEGILAVGVRTGGL